MKNCAFLVFLLVFDLSIDSSSGSSHVDGSCVSQGGRFPPFASEGKPPRKVSRGEKDLTLCRLFRKKTCCDAAQTYPALLSIRKLTSTGEASRECLQLWELLECSICDPRVGIQPGPPLICSSFCDRVFQSCSDAYFSMDVKNQVLAPCGVNDFVCGRASEWVLNGSEFCRAAGFSVQSSDKVIIGTEVITCYGDKTSFDSIADSWKASKFDARRKTGKVGLLNDFQSWMLDMPISERVSWAVGGMVLTAGLLFMSKRKSHNQRQKLAAIQRTARRLEGKIKETSPISQGHRKAARK